MSNKFNIKLLRVIGVDTASYAYVEIPLDDNIMLIGTGNIGKTSLVNAIRFFFLPELSLTNCAENFGFKKTNKDQSKKGFFNADEVKDHYFPSANSRLIVELEQTLLDGSVHRSCQIISGGSNYKLLRHFVDCPFDDIAHLFWDRDYGEKGVGGAPETTISNNLQATLKQFGKHAKQVTSREELINTLYSADNIDRNNSRFTIFPLPKINSGTVKSLKAVIKLLFNMDAAALRIMTANIIDLENGSGGQLEVDINELLVEHESLKKERLHLKKIRGFAGKFEKLNQDFNNQSALQLYERETAITLLQWGVYKTTLDGQLSNLNQSLSPLTENAKKLDDTTKKIQGIKIELDAEVRIHSRGKAKEEEKVRKGETILSQERTTDIKGAIEGIEAHIEILQGEVRNYTSEADRNQNIASMTIELDKAKGDLALQKTRKANKQYSLENQLSKSSHVALNCVNANILKCNPSETLAPHIISQIEGFADLFEIKQGDAYLFDGQFINPGLEPEDTLEQNIETLNETIFSLGKKIAELKKIENENAIISADKVSKNEREIEKDEKDIEILKQLENSRIRLDGHTEALLEKENNLKKYEAEQETHEEEVVKNKEQKDELEAQQKVLNEKIRDLEALLTQTSMLRQSYPRVDSLIKQNHDEIQLPEVFKPPCLEDISVISKRLNEGDAGKARVINTLREFIDEGIADDTESIKYAENITFRMIKTTMAQLNQTFGLVEQKDVNLANRTSTHNEYIRARMDVLSSTKALIERQV